MSSYRDAAIEDHEKASVKAGCMRDTLEASKAAALRELNTLLDARRRTMDAECISPTTIKSIDDDDCAREQLEDLFDQIASYALTPLEDRENATGWLVEQAAQHEAAADLADMGGPVVAVPPLPTRTQEAA